jgi:GTP-binding protein
MSNTSKHPISYLSARFLTSAEKLTQCPQDSGVEIAFAGRSNAGKSSAINTITQNSKLAKTSKTPGRTQLINFFTLNKPGCRLVDLPGYGFAKVSKSLVQNWQKHLQDYLEHRRALKALVLVMDIRHPLTDFDCHMLNWCESRALPSLVLLTKADKIKSGIAKSTLHQVAKDLHSWSHPIDIQLFSAFKNTGTEDARAYLDQFYLTSEEN